MSSINRLSRRSLNSSTISQTTSSLKLALEANLGFEAKINKYDVKLCQTKSGCAYLEEKEQCWAIELKECEAQLSALKLS